MKNEKTDSFGEWLGFSAACVFAITRIGTSVYKKALDYLSRQHDAMHPEAHQKMQKLKLEQKQADALQMKKALSNPMVKEVAQAIKASGRKLVGIEHNETGYIIKGNAPVDTFIEKYLGSRAFDVMMYPVAASVHTAIYYSFRRLFISETPSKSFNEALAGTVPAFAFLTFSDLKSAYEHTLQYSNHKQALTDMSKTTAVSSSRKRK